MRIAALIIGVCIMGIFAWSTYELGKAITLPDDFNFDEV